MVVVDVFGQRRMQRKSSFLYDNEHFDQAAAALLSVVWHYLAAGSCDYGSLEYDRRRDRRQSEFVGSLRPEVELELACRRMTLQHLQREPSSFRLDAR